MGLFDGVNRNLAYGNIIKKLSGTAITSVDGIISRDNEALIRAIVNKTNGKSDKIRAAFDLLIQNGLITASTGAAAQLNFETVIKVTLPQIMRNQEQSLEDIVRIAKILVLLNASGLLARNEDATRNRTLIATYESLGRASLLLSRLEKLKEAQLLSSSNSYAQLYVDLAFTRTDTKTVEEITGFLIVNKGNGKSAAIAILASLGHTEALLASFEKWPALTGIFLSLESSGLFSDGNENAQENLTALIATSADKLQDIALICDSLKDTPIFLSTHSEARNNFVRLLNATTNTSALVASLGNASIIDLLSNPELSQNCFETILSPDQNSANLTRLLDENRALAGSILSVYMNLKVKNFFAEESAERFETFRNAVDNIEAINVILKKLEGSWILTPENSAAVANITTILQNHAVVTSINNIIAGGAFPDLLLPDAASGDSQSYFDRSFANTNKLQDIENIVSEMQGRDIFTESGSDHVHQVFIDTVTAPGLNTSDLLSVIRALNATAVFTGESPRENFRKILTSCVAPATLIGYLQNDDVRTLLSNPQVAQRSFDLLVNSGEIAVRLSAILAANAGDMENIINLYSRLEGLGYFESEDLDSKFELFQAAVSRAVQINELLISFSQNRLLGRGITSTPDNINIILRMPVSGFAVLQRLHFATFTEVTRYLSLLPISEEQLGHLNSVLSNLPVNLAAGSGLRVVEQRVDFELLSPVFTDAEIKSMLETTELGQACFELLLASGAQIEQTSAILKANRENLAKVLSVYKDFEGCSIDKINTLLTATDSNFNGLLKLISIPVLRELINTGNKNEIIELLINSEKNWGSLHKIFEYLLTKTYLLIPDNIKKLLKAHELSNGLLTVMLNYEPFEVFTRDDESANNTFLDFLTMKHTLNELAEAQKKLKEEDLLNRNTLFILATAAVNNWNMSLIVQSFIDSKENIDSLGNSQITQILFLLKLKEYTQEQFLALANAVIVNKTGDRIINVIQDLINKNILTEGNKLRVFNLLVAYVSEESGNLVDALDEFIKKILPSPLDGDAVLDALTLFAKNSKQLFAIAESLPSKKCVSNEEAINNLYTVCKTFTSDISVLMAASSAKGTSIGATKIARQYLRNGSDAGAPRGPGSAVFFSYKGGGAGGSTRASDLSRTRSCVSMTGSTAEFRVEGQLVSEARYFISKLCKDEVDLKISQMAGERMGSASIREFEDHDLGL